VPDFYIERAFASLTAADERALSRRLESCARSYPVRWHKCLIDGARSRILCHLEADSLPAARAAALCLGVTRDGVWLSAVPWAPAIGIADSDPATTGEPHSQATSGTPGWTPATRDADLVHVMAEWQLNTPTDALDFARAQNVCDWCLDTLRVRPESVASTADGRRVVTFFCAPDAESVRNAYRYATVPFDRVTALRHLNR